MIIKQPIPEHVTWSDRVSSLVPWAMWTHLKANFGKPYTYWCKDLHRCVPQRHCLYVLEPLELPLHVASDDNLRPYCCYSHTVIFYRPWMSPGPAAEVHRLDYPQRSCPVSLFADNGRVPGNDHIPVFEVTGAKVIHVLGRWHVEWRCGRTTEWARHFNGECEPGNCRPCAFIEGK